VVDKTSVDNFLVDMWITTHNTKNKSQAKIIVFIERFLCFPPGKNKAIHKRWKRLFLVDKWWIR
jgi:hypothetical protein